jgi:septum formation protein
MSQLQSILRSSNMKLILASQSPRRQELLRKLDAEFEAISADIDETWHEDETPYEYVQRLAIEKAMKISAENNDAAVIGGDTTLDFENKAIAKSENEEEASAVLAKLAGHTHQVHTGFALVNDGRIFVSGVTSATITFREISTAEIEEYLRTDHWQDKAGSYAIQGKAAAFVKDFTGSYYDILGLSVYQVAAGLITIGMGIDPLKLNMLYQDESSLKQRVLSSDNLSDFASC